MTRNPDRPLSPHLTIWKWGPDMLVSILHRLTGGGAGGRRRSALLTWWLWAIAGGRATTMQSFVEACGEVAASARHASCWSG